MIPWNQLLPAQHNNRYKALYVKGSSQNDFVSYESDHLFRLSGTDFKQWKWIYYELSRIGGPKYQIETGDQGTQTVTESEYLSERNRYVNGNDIRTYSFLYNTADSRKKVFGKR